MELSMYDVNDFTEGLESNPIYYENLQLSKSMKTFKYICSNIPGPGCNMDNYVEQFCGCNCQPSCELISCSCIEQQGLNYQNGRLLENIICGDSSKAILECNSKCSCDRACSNRLVQNGIKYKLEVFTVKHKGLALRTLETIPRGSFVCEYAGEIVSEEEANKRSKKLTKDDMNYLFVLKEHCASGIIQTFIDPKYKGNIGRMINHSCDPNLTMHPVRINNSIPRLALFANTDIELLEELSFSYGSSSNCDTDKGVNKKACYCGVTMCKNYLPFDTSVFL
ncbi:histone-lysine N-methyltransferase SETMAR [Patella vulgata]|uniref:histone-lysine N-methyltransferase SETMAR n=1 Tax=Patella vulgata TaxID=6465 RepID=UPI00217F9DE8|nr:histone-lysine N-methyltransferase SETMAR [Patella vulgata]